MEKKTIHNLIILDESGSMETIKMPTINGFNEVVQTIKGARDKFPEQEHFISLFTFNSEGIKTKLYRQPVAELQPIDASIYQPGSLTPLFDAIGTSVSKLKYDLAATPEAKVLVTILTDGEENASREYSGPQIKELIDKQKEEGWTFTYIGANHDVEKAAMSISITNTIQFDATAGGTKRAFASDSRSRMAYMAKVQMNQDVQANYFVEDDEPAQDDKTQKP